VIRVPSPNPSQGEVPAEAIEAGRLVLQEAAASRPEPWARAVLSAALPAIRSQIDQEWEERLEGEAEDRPSLENALARADALAAKRLAPARSERKIESLSLLGRIAYLGDWAEDERARANQAEERLKEVERQRDEWEARYRVASTRCEISAGSADRAEAALAERDQQVRELSKALAVAVLAGYYEDSLPDDLYADPFEAEGLLQTTRDVTDEYVTNITPEGRQFLHDVLTRSLTQPSSTPLQQDPEVGEEPCEECGGFLDLHRGDCSKRASLADPEEATRHELKCWPRYFDDLLAGRLTFQIRRDDRGYKVGDVLVLREYRPRTGLEWAPCDYPDQEKARYSGRQCERVVTHVYDDPYFGSGLLRGYVLLSIAPSTQPVSESPGNSGERCPSCASTDPFALVGVCSEDGRPTDPWHVRQIEVLGRECEECERGVYREGAEWAPCENCFPQRDDDLLPLVMERIEIRGAMLALETVIKHDDGITPACMPRALAKLKAAAATQPVPGNSGREGRWRIEDSGDWLSRYDALTRAEAIKHTAERLGAFFKDEGEHCTDEEAADEATEIIDAAYAAPNVAQEQDGVCVTFVPAASTQPSSPQAEVQDCSCKGSGCPKCNFGGARCGGTKVISVSDTVSGFRTLTGCRGCPDCTGKQSPAEPQGDEERWPEKAVELLAERLFRFHAIATGSAARWDTTSITTKNSWREDARSHLTKLFPLLALDVRERLEGLLSDEAIEAAVRVWCQGFDAFPRGTQREAMSRQRLAFRAALDAPAPSEPEEGK
jgi:hypothetical protein